MPRGHGRCRGAERIERPRRRRARQAVCRCGRLCPCPPVVWRPRPDPRHLRNPLGDFFRRDRPSCRFGMPAYRLCGTSKGAEAALLVAAHDPRIDAVVAISPTSVVWGNIGPGADGVSWPERSSWTLKGLPFPFVPTDPNWKASCVDGVVSYRGLFEHCLTAFKEEAGKAAIPVEDISATVMLVAGGDDALWPSLGICPLDCPTSARCRKGHAPGFGPRRRPSHSPAWRNHTPLKLACAWRR